MTDYEIVDYWKQCPQFKVCPTCSEPGSFMSVLSDQPLYWDVRCSMCKHVLTIIKPRTTVNLRDNIVILNEHY